MPTNPPLLNQLQVDVLAWIRDGCPAGVYEEGFQHRISARALERRGLVDVRGHGESWTATLTEDGSYYLEHGDYPPRQAEPPRTSTHTKPSPSQSRSAEPPKKPSTPRAKPAPRIGPTDAMMAALAAAEDHRIVIEYEQVQRYEQLAKTAERFKKIPDGMRVVVAHDWRVRTAEVSLLPLPVWRTRVLDPIRVPTTLRGTSEVVTAIGARDDLDIRASEKKRALRLLHALVGEARRREYVVSAVPVPRKDRWGYVNRADENVGLLMIKLGPDEYRLTIYQLTEKVEHVASKSELARAGRGYALPKWDHLPTPRLGIRIDTEGGHFWGTYWVDTGDRSLEAALPQILQELELRHEAAGERRQAEERQRLERRRQWEAAREKAIEALTDQTRAAAVTANVARWAEAVRIRKYVAHVEANSLPMLDGEDRADALAWLTWARGYAEKLDPSGERLRLPDPPEPTPTALQPFMGSWSPYGPERY